MQLGSSDSFAYPIRDDIPNCQRRRRGWAWGVNYMDSVVTELEVEVFGELAGGGQRLGADAGAASFQVVAAEVGDQPLSGLYEHRHAEGTAQLLITHLWIIE